MDAASSLLSFCSAETHSHLEKICFLTFPFSLTALSNLVLLDLTTLSHPSYSSWLKITTQITKLLLHMTVCSFFSLKLFSPFQLPSLTFDWKTSTHPLSLRNLPLTSKWAEWVVSANYSPFLFPSPIITPPRPYYNCMFTCLASSSGPKALGWQGLPIFSI